MPYNIVLVHPQIPNNTGNIGRLCVATNSVLHLIKPLGFEITDKQVRRAGLDYWPDLEHFIYESFDDFLEQRKPDRLAYFSSHGKLSFWDYEFDSDQYLVFGREADGLPPDIKGRNDENNLIIPFPGKVRSFNLANSVSIALFEALRQEGQ